MNEGLQDADATALVETANVLDMQLDDDAIGDLSLLEAATPTPTSHAQRRPGESLTSYGNRLKAGDKRAEAAHDAAMKTKPARTTQTRSGANGDFEKQHPRGRGGSWTFKAGASGNEVTAIQRHVGATTTTTGGKTSDKPGSFGSTTTAAVKSFQKKHGLQVDGVVGAQTAAAMLGNKNAAGVKVGKMDDATRKKLANGGKPNMRGSKKLSESAVGKLTIGDVGDLSLLEAPAKKGEEGPMNKVLCPKCSKKVQPNNDKKCPTCSTSLSGQIAMSKRIKAKAGT